MIKMKINTKEAKVTINKNIYGHFSEHLGRCIYGGIWVGHDSDIPNTEGIRNDVIEVLKDMKIPLLRWPGGCFADEYHWKDGIGPNEERPTMINTHWGGVTENNHFGTHEFLKFCELIGAEPYISGNLGSGTVREMQEWVEYITFDGVSPMANLRKKNGKEQPWKLKYFGIGNENWGCGGNMRAEYYVDEYRKYATYVRNYNDNTIYKIACGPNADNYNWTEVLMKNTCDFMSGLSLHYYTVPGDWNSKGSAALFEEKDWFITLKKTLFMEELVTKHSDIMDQYDPDKKVGLIVDEWGTWFDVEPGTNPGFLYQQNTLRDAMVAGINLNIFNNHSDRVQMANIAQLVNVLQSILLTDGEKLILTPTYHVFKMYNVHQDAKLLATQIINEEYLFDNQKLQKISVSSSIDSEGKIHISLCNLDPNQDSVLSCELVGGNYTIVSGSILTASGINAMNTFEHPDQVIVVPFNNVTISENNITATIPAKSIVVLEVE